MGLFTKKQKLKIIPRTKESKFGGQYLMDIVKGGAPTIPTREVADLTPMQQMLMKELPGILEGTKTSAELAKGEMRKTIEGGYDPLTSPEYRGLREETERRQTKGLTTLRQGAELGGMLKSTPRLGAESDFLAASESNLLKQLGAMFERERVRKGEAARDIQGVEGQKIGQVAAVGGLAETERMVEEQRNQALYAAAIQQILFPYQTMSNIASALLNVKKQGVPMGGGLTDLGFGLSTLASFGGSYYGAKAGG
jgi:hypothetical protein